MGAWNYGVFDDDTAYDALEELQETSDIIADMEEYFDKVIQADYVEFDEGIYALVSSAIIDIVLNGTDYECDVDYDEWITSIKQIDFSGLKQKAIKAIEAVLSDDSELKELWEENEELYDSWREDKISIQKRLQE